VPSVDIQIFFPDDSHLLLQLRLDGFWIFGMASGDSDWSQLDAQYLPWRSPLTEMPPAETVAFSAVAVIIRSVEFWF